MRWRHYQPTTPGGLLFVEWFGTRTVLSVVRPVCRSILIRSIGLHAVLATIPAKPPQTILLDSPSVALAAGRLVDLLVTNVEQDGERGVPVVAAEEEERLWIAIGGLMDIETKKHNQLVLLLVPIAVLVN